eukprot:TRINITY_DN488_c3_g1_i2.p1 TRINITY_DN488_c3_g1~~TRINITY_DN488_c3_g1_i2.p1  ORF type:complete len:550 (-),score=184.32 TRINITY_DN488_c3_g1_i2:320-1969(-)
MQGAFGVCLLAAISTALGFAPAAYRPPTSVTQRPISGLGQARWGRRHSSSSSSSTRLRMLEEEKEAAAAGADKKKGGLSIPNPFLDTFNAGRSLRETLDEALDQFTGGKTSKARVGFADAEALERRLYSQFDSPEEVPEVLVVGATGETGRVVVRKLLLRGFKVRVLVRNLYSSTLDLLGTGVTYTQGDLGNAASIVDAVSGVDKVMFLAQSRDDSAQDVEFAGFKNLISTFQDARVADYGTAFSTKRTLFKFNRPMDRELWSLAKEAARLKWAPNKFDHGTLGGVGVQELGDLSVESPKLDLNMGAFSGLVVRLLGDGKQYRIILRTKLYETNGVQFESVVQTKPNKWQTHRLPFSTFEAHVGGTNIEGAQQVRLDRRDVKQIAVAYRRAPSDDGTFIVSLDFIKVYRTQLEPEFIYVSSAAVPPFEGRGVHEYDDTVLAQLQARDKKAYWSAMGENALRKSGLTYTIVRVAGFNNAPGGIQAIKMQQDQDGVGLISRADAAEICVSCLLDPRACNLAFYASQSKYAPTAISPDKDMSAELARMRPNT